MNYPHSKYPNKVHWSPWRKIASFGKQTRSHFIKTFALWPTSSNPFIRMGCCQSTSANKRLATDHNRQILAHFLPPDESQACRFTYRYGAYFKTCKMPEKERVLSHINIALAVLKFHNIFLSKSPMSSPEAASMHCHHVQKTVMSRPRKKTNEHFTWTHWWVMYGLNKMGDRVACFCAFQGWTCRRARSGEN